MKHLTSKITFLFATCFGIIVIGCIVEVQTREYQTKNTKHVPESVCGNASFEMSAANKVFKTNCAACHKIDKTSIAPMLRGVMVGEKNKQWVRLFLTKEDSLIKAKDSLTLTVNNGELKVKHTHDYAFLSNEDIIYLLELMK